MDGPFSQPPADDHREWLPVAIGAVAVVIILALIYFIGGGPQPVTGPAAEDAYTNSLQFSALHLSQANNFVGASVTYLEGKVANTGSMTLSEVRIESVFRNTLGEVVQRETQPLQLLQERPGYTDNVPLTQDPLFPNASRDFRLTYEHISTDWNQGLPELRVLKVTGKEN